jgi:hypothetical protein
MRIGVLTAGMHAYPCILTRLVCAGMSAHHRGPCRPGVTAPGRESPHPAAAADSRHKAHSSREHWAEGSQLAYAGATSRRSCQCFRVSCCVGTKRQVHTPSSSLADHSPSCMALPSVGTGTQTAITSRLNLPHPTPTNNPTYLIVRTCGISQGKAIMTPQTSCLLHYSYCCSTAGTMSKHGPPWHVGSLSRDVWNE